MKYYSIYHCIVIILLAQLSLSGQAGNFEWAVGGSSMFSNEAFDVVNDSKGNYYVVGGFSKELEIQDVELTELGALDIFFAKFDVDGNLIWAQSLGGSSNDRVEAIEIDENDNVTIAGYLSGAGYIGSDGLEPVYVYGFSEKLLFVASYNELGEVISNSTMECSTSPAVVDIELRNNQTYIHGYYNGTIAFTSTNGLENLESNVNRMFTAGINAEGEVFFFNQLNSELKSYGNGMAIGQDDSYILACSFEDQVEINGQQFNSADASDGLLLEYNFEGDLIWHVQFSSENTNGENGLEAVRAVEFDNENNLIIGGFFSHELNLGQVSLISANTFDPFVIKYDEAKTMVWAKSFQGDSTVRMESMDIDQNGDILLTGSFFETLKADDLEVESVGESDIFVSKLDKDGNLIWLTRAGSEGNDIGLSISVDAANDAIICGRLYAGADSEFGDHVVNGSNANFNNAFAAKLYGTATTGTNNNNYDSALAIFPNPTSTFLDIKGAKEGSFIKIYSSNGQLVKKDFFSKTPLNVSDLEAGVYFIVLEHKAQTTQTKFLKI